MSDLNLDSHDAARAIHRVVRAMHDGECPKCHTLHDARYMIAYNPSGERLLYHECPSCKFRITANESEEAIALFSKFMDRNLEIFEEWRKTL